MTRYVEERRDAFGVKPICRTLGVPVSTHYARRSRKPSARELADRKLLLEIEAARSGRRKVYGARKTWKELKRRDVDVGRDRVARVMRQHGLEGKLRGRKHRTTAPDEAAAERALSKRDGRADRLPASQERSGPGGSVMPVAAFSVAEHGWCHLNAALGLPNPSARARFSWQRVERRRFAGLGLCDVPVASAPPGSKGHLDL